MAKARDQKFFTDILYGSEASSGSLRLESTTAFTKGIVEIVGTSADLIIGGVVGRFTHANTALRTYTFPDFSGTLISGGFFTAANQLLYSTGANAFTTLSPVNGAVLTTSAGGVPTWITGANGTFLQMSGGVPVLGSLPANVGTIADAAQNSLAIYAGPGVDNNLAGLTITANRALLSNGLSVPVWTLITAPYLSASGAVPLNNGTAGQTLKSNGDGTFFWDTDAGLINPGTQFRLPFYSAAGAGVDLDDSVFLETDEIARSLKLLNNGTLRFYELTVNGSNYLEFKAPPAVGANVIWTLPAIDGAAGSVLQTNGSGVLSFVTLADNGSVAAGLTNQLAYYSSNGNDVQGLATVTGRVLLSPAGVLSWSLLTAPYLSALGGVALSNGTLNQALVSNGDGTFNWATVSSLVGLVNAGTVNNAAYYAASGSAVSPSSFVDFVDASRRVDLKDNGIVRFHESTGSGSNYVEIRAGATLGVSTSYVLPLTDGTFEQALVTDGAGNLSFIDVGRGIVNSGAINTLAYYAAAGDAVSSFANVASRVMVTTAGNVISWALLTEEYLATTGGSPLSGGVAGEVLISDGLGNFLWAAAASLTGSIQSGVSGFVGYYPTSGTTINDSAFLFTDNAAAELHLLNQGELRFYETTNTNYVGFTVSNSIAGDTLWNLPLADATLAGQVLVSDAAGNLSFEDQVDPGTVNALAYYQAATRRVSPAATVDYTGSGFALSGALFSIEGEDGGTPTAVTMTSGSGVGVAGADLTLQAGDSDVSTFGRIFLGVGSNNLVRIEDLDPGLYVSLLASVNLRFYDNDSSNYVGFKAPTVVTSDVVWALPAADGTASQVLSTDGAGNLSWVSVTTGVTINTGTTNALSFYSAPNVIDDSQLLAPVGFPGANDYALLVSTGGQLSYGLLVETSGPVGSIAFYTASQTVGHSTLLVFDEGNKEVELGDQTALQFFELAGNGTDFVGLRAPAALASSYTVDLPADAPSTGQVLLAASSTALTYSYSDETASRQKRGKLFVESGASEITVLYEEPFTSKPDNIQISWSIEDVSGIASLPSFGVMLNTVEGFVAKLSTTTTKDYYLYWESYLSGDTTNFANAYFAAGDDSGTLLAEIYSLNMDVGTTAVLAGSLSSTRAYIAGTSSSTKGYMLGGQSGLVSIDTISTFNYSTGTVADIVALLPAVRSSAAAVGTRMAGYAAGGEEIGVGPYLTIAKIVHATETTSTVAGPLNANAIGRGSANNATDGYIVNSNGTSTVDILDFGLDTVTAGPNNFGVADIQAGCNDLAGDIGYFGRTNGALYSYDFSTDTITLLGAALNSVTGLSGAANSMTNGFFGGESDLDRFSFSTNTVTAAAAFVPTQLEAASVATFQTRGLL